MGIFGAGNVGTAATTFGMPLLLAAMGWRGAFRVYAVVLLVTALAYAVAMPTAPSTSRRSVRDLLAPMWKRDAWYLGFLYMATFGVFVDTTLTLGDVYIDRYGVTARTAGLLATTFTLTASLLRIAGGALTDRFGATRVTRLALPAVGLGLLPVVFGPSLSVTVALVMASGVAMGIGMASVMKLVPEYFPSSVGAVGGIVGALGGVAGFYLPIMSAPIGRIASSEMQLLPAIALSLGAAVVFAVRSRPVAPTATLIPLAQPAKAREQDSRKAA
jgi:NNP family nitrate/nitrite transporter-like MFS transporter